MKTLHLSLIIFTLLLFNVGSFDQASYAENKNYPASEMQTGTGIFNMMSSTGRDTTEWKTYNATPEFANIPLPAKQTFNVQYVAINGTIESFQLIPSSSSFEVKVRDQNGSSGKLEIKIPKNYPYTNENLTSPTNLYVALDSGSIRNYTMKQTDCFFVYSIPFSHDYSNIKLIFPYVLEWGAPHGNKVPDHCISETIFSSPVDNMGTTIPEFPFAVPVLMISILSIIVFYRMKFR